MALWSEDFENHHLLVLFFAITFLDALQSTARKTLVVLDVLLTCSSTAIRRGESTTHHVPPALGFLDSGTRHIACLNAPLMRRAQHGVGKGERRMDVEEVYMHHLLPWT